MHRSTYQAELIEDLSRLEHLTAEWDALAVMNAQPLSSPAWMLGWLRHAAPSGTALRLIAVHDREQLVGIAPFCVDLSSADGHGSYRLLADNFAPCVTPLALANHEWEVAQAVAGALAKAEPRPAILSLNRLPVTSPWALALREGWPGRVRPVAFRNGLQTVATVLLQPSFEKWFESRSAHFRRNIRRYRRLFDREGGTARLSTASTVAADIQTFVRLHAGRWERRGASRLVALGDRLPVLLGELAGELLSEDRFRLLVLEVDGEPISAELSIAAGGEIAGFNMGWDERFRSLAPPRLSLLHTIEAGFERGEQRFNLGWGELDFKRAFADCNDAIASHVLVPVERRLPQALMRVAPAVANRRLIESAKRTLSADQLGRLQTVRSRLRREGRVGVPPSAPPRSSPTSSLDASAVTAPEKVCEPISNGKALIRAHDQRTRSDL
ncbi:MAG TPA: GNAT family N-acetyltransferase [Solirubrobacteraceae bacterium]